MDWNSKRTIRPLTHKELAGLYNVSWLTFQKWLKPHMGDIGKKTGHFYNTKQVMVIFDKLGWPEIELEER